jgi:ubiquinone/menaquinone biosynthesis C-methylase UbiE
MNIRDAYDSWADKYDTNDNRTRDLEAVSLRESLSHIQFESCLEIGCGTGKNTEWLITRAKHITAVDLSAAMLDKAKEKIISGRVRFVQADITREWTFAEGHYDLVTFSLVLEHIEDLDEIFRKVSRVTRPGSFVYIGELHPFKQYTGTKARFETNEGHQQVLTCFNHNISDFIRSAKGNGFEIDDISEYFDGGDKNSIPRILSLMLKKISD